MSTNSLRNRRSAKVAGLRRSDRAIVIPPSTRQVNDANTAYFSGLIDGEGYVTLAKNINRKSGPVWNVPTIVLAMCHLETVLACASYFGCGCVHISTLRQKKNPHHSPIYIWTIRWNDARRVAAMLRPFAITKAEALDRIINLPPARKGPNRKFDDETIRCIRRDYAEVQSYLKLGRKYGVGGMTAWKIVNRKMYADVI